jgi:hypothetical protein
MRSSQQRLASLMSSDALHWALLSALLFCGGCVTAVPIDTVRDTKFTVESVYSVYLIDGAGIDRRVWSYSLDEGQLEQIGELPKDYYGRFVADILRGAYLRVAQDGIRLFALLSVGFGYNSNDVIVEIDLPGRKLRTLWSGKLSRQSVFDISLPLPEQLSDDSVEALFGSREFPVFAPPVLQGSAFLFLREVQAGSVWKSLGLGLRPHDADRIRGPHDVADVLLALALEFDKPGRKPQMKSADGVFAFQHQALAWNWPPD